VILRNARCNDEIHRVMVFENRRVGKNFGSNREEVMGEYSRLLSSWRHKYYSNHQIK